MIIYRLVWSLTLKFDINTFKLSSCYDPLNIYFYNCGSALLFIHGINLTLDMVKSSRVTGLVDFILEDTVLSFSSL